MPSLNRASIYFYWQMDRLKSAQARGLANYTSKRQCHPLFNRWSTILKLVFMFHDVLLCLFISQNKWVSPLYGAKRQSVWVVKTLETFQNAGLRFAATLTCASQLTWSKLVGEFGNYSHRGEASLTVTFHPDSALFWCQIQRIIGC